MPRESFDRLLERLNLALHRPTQMLGPHHTPQYCQFLAGHLCLDSMNPGDGRTYVLEEVKKNGGLARPLGNTRRTPKEMRLILEALIAVAIDGQLKPFSEDHNPYVREDRIHCFNHEVHMMDCEACVKADQSGSYPLTA